VNPKVLALDVATSMGCAFGRPQERPVSWSYDFGKWRDHDARFAQAMRFIREMHKQLLPDLIAIEAPIGGKDANAYLVGMVACMRGQARDLGMVTVEYHAATVRKYFIGKALTSRHFPGLAQAKAKIEIKQRVAERCRELGWEFPNLDAADALSLWSYACSEENREHGSETVGGLFGEQK
jgi:Holliday junction resolvasome RuvABC endonuclease subunit